MPNIAALLAGRDYVDDVLVADGLSFADAHMLAYTKNCAEPGDSPSYYRVVDDDYELQRFEP